MGRVFLVGIAGDSASGKSTFAKGIINLFGKNRVSSISLDDYHLYDREERKKLKITPLNPKANNFDLMVKHAQLLKEGKSIKKPVYNHSNGKFKEPILFKPKDIVILEGLLPFYDKRLYRLFNITIFIDPDYEVRKEWKIKRDVEERGHSLNALISEMEKRKPDYERYVAPQRKKAEILIKIKKERKEPHYRKGTPYWIRIYQKLTGEHLSKVYFPLDLTLMCRIEGEELYFEYRKGFYGKTPVSIIEFNGTVEKKALKDIEEKIAEIAGRPKRKIFEKGKYVDEIGLGNMIIAWRVAERFKLFKGMMGKGGC